MKKQTNLKLKKTVNGTSVYGPVTVSHPPGRLPFLGETAIQIGGLDPASPPSRVAEYIAGRSGTEPIEALFHLNLELYWTGGDFENPVGDLVSFAWQEDSPAPPAHATVLDLYRCFVTEGSNPIGIADTAGETRIVLGFLPGSGDRRDSILFNIVQLRTAEKPICPGAVLEVRIPEISMKRRPIDTPLAAITDEPGRQIIAWLWHVANLGSGSPRPRRRPPSSKPGGDNPGRDGHSRRR